MVTPFEANRPVVVSGVTVRPGDYVFADASGAARHPRCTGPQRVRGGQPHRTGRGNVRREHPSRKPSD
ncbi:hypothetical protein [Streptomyces sp. F001]|uniref:RraA family protein n=1 Tax=Streptomyces sp. F001 TaxID=1510026 RepID=UPI0032083319